MPICFYCPQVFQFLADTVEESHRSEMRASIPEAIPLGSSARKVNFFEESGRLQSSLLGNHSYPAEILFTVKEFGVMLSVASQAMLSGGLL